MHPDLKVGLALAMLIVGFAGAMCFRHPPLEDAAQQVALPLDDGLNEELELLPVRTYTSEPEATESINPAVADGGEEILPTTDGELVIPDPIAFAQDPESATDSTADTSPSADAVPPADSTTESYVVRSGDTLSGIAGRLLGSTQRYEEIFEANRHQLNSPNDLRPGMELVIPPKVRPVDVPLTEESPTEASAVEAAASGSDPTPATVQRFTPIVPR